MVAFEASPALFAGPEVHQDTFLRILADYTYACFIYVIVSDSTCIHNANSSNRS